MDRTRKYHPECGNPIVKEHTWYALTDKWILAQKLQITRIQFTDHMKLKKEKDQSLGASVQFFLERRTTYSGEQIWRQSVEQRLKERPSRDCPTWGFIPDNSHQTLTLLWMLRNACWRSLIDAVSWEALPERDKYRGRCSQPTIGLSLGSLIEELEKGLKGFASP